MVNEELIRYDAFCEDYLLNRKHDPWFKKKPKEQIYQECILTSCGKKDCSLCKQYEPYFGVKFLGQLRLRNANSFTKDQELYDVYPVIIRNSFIHSGRSICEKHVNLI